MISTDTVGRLWFGRLTSMPLRWKKASLRVSVRERRAQSTVSSK